MKIILQQVKDNLQALEDLKIPNQFNYHVEDNRKKENLISRYNAFLEFLNNSDKRDLDLDKLAPIINNAQLEVDTLLAKYL